MYYNVAFDVVTLILILGIVLSNVLQAEQRDISKSYKTSIELLFVSTVFDILAMLSGGDVIFALDELNMIFETVYMCIGLYALYSVFLTYASRIKYDSKRSSQIIFGFVTIYTFLLLINIPTHILFAIHDGAYELQFLFYVAYTIPVYVMLHTIFILLKCRKKIETKIYVAMLCAAICPVLAVLIQLLNDRLVLIQFGLAITLLVLNFIWETPDAKKIHEAVGELEISREEAAAKRMEIEMANRVKNRFLDGITDRFLEPIDVIQNNATQIKNSNEAVHVKDNAENILRASEQFKELLVNINSNQV